MTSFEWCNFSLFSFFKIFSKKKVGIVGDFLESRKKVGANLKKVGKVGKVGVAMNIQ